MAGAALGCLCATMAGCGGDDSPSGGDHGPYAHLVERAEQVRELRFVEAVPTRTLTPEQFRDEVSQDVDDNTDADLRAYADTYGRLGFFDVHLDLRPILTQSRVDATAAYYSPVTTSITFVGAPEDSTVVHEYVHALQDQHFDLTRYDDGARSSDAYLARRAVTEGDATFAEARFQFEEQTGGAGIDRIDYADYFAGWSAWSERYLDDSGYPLIFRAYASFVYPYGLFFSAANLFGVSPLVRRPPPPPHQWSRQDALFTDRAPATTAEILGQTDPVVAVGIDAIPAALAADLERLGTDTLGTWYTYLLFRPVASGLLLAGAWDGDRVLFARHTATGTIGVLWASAWDNESAAMAAEAALHALHDRAGEPLVIEHRGVRVVLARNFPGELVHSLVDAAFAGSAAPRLASRPGRPPLHVRNWVPGPAHPTILPGGSPAKIRR